MRTLFPRPSSLLPMLAPALLAALPAAAAPDRVAATIEGADDAIDIVALPDGTGMVFADGSRGAIGFLDFRDWSVSTLSTCGGAVGAAVWEGESETWIYQGCADGTLVYVVYEDGDLSLSTETVALDAAEILGVTVVDDVVYAVAEQKDGGNPRVHGHDPVDNLTDGDLSTGLPSTLGENGFTDIEGTSGFVYVSGTGDNLSKVTVPGGGATTAYNNVGDIDDPDLVISASGGSVLAGGGLAVARFNADNEWSLLIDDQDGLDDVRALCLLEDEGSIMVADGTTMKRFQWFSSSGDVGDELQDSFELPESTTAPTEMAFLDDYLVAATSDGSLHVMTDRPWVEVTATTPTTAVDGDTVQITFTADVDGDVEVRVGGSSDTDGTVLVEGTATADESQTVTVEVGDDWAEGDNYVRVVVTDDSGRTGHDSAVVSIDNPPPKIGLSDDSVGWGDGYLDLSFTAPGDEDIATVQVYLTVTSFSADDWDEGGPDFDGDDDIDTAALTVDVTPSEAVTVRIYPLTNDQTYYLAVRATDAGGLEGPMSNIVTGTPTETYGVAELAGDDGGFCGAVSGAASLGLAGLAGLLGLARRRRRGTAAAAVAMVGLGLSAPAHAGEASDATDHEEPQVRSSVDIRFGPMYWDDGNEIRDVMGDSGHNVLWLEFGPSWRGLANLTVGTGFYRKKGNLVADSGASSDQDSVFWTVPLTLNLTARLDVLPEQWVVPYASFGGDYWFWREGWNESADLTDRSGVGGGKYGYHYAFGGQVLLDIFEPKRASTAFSRLGIRDTYATVEWRRQEVGAFQDGIDLSNQQLTFGLRMHY
ncbi:MAG: hypothetical protein H6742_07235 [Alphaproteobacteria bacterium]|nr:hypothetical protein [Alphaproteobacteria bacterium]